MTVEGGGRARAHYTGELEQLALQVELMALHVGENLSRIQEVLRAGDVDVIDVAVATDNEIDSMSVTLTERAYDLLRRETPVASDFRFVVSVIRVVEDLERIGENALRVVRLAPRYDHLAVSVRTLDVLVAMAGGVREAYERTTRAWAAMDADLAAELGGCQPRTAELYERFVDELTGIDAANPIAVAVDNFTAGRSLERIANHVDIIGARLLYLITGDPDHLIREVRS